MILTNFKFIFAKHLLPSPSMVKKHLSFCIIRTRSSLWLVKSFKAPVNQSSEVLLVDLNECSPLNMSSFLTWPSIDTWTTGHFVLDSCILLFSSCLVTVKSSRWESGIRTRNTPWWWISKVDISKFVAISSYLSKFKSLLNRQLFKNTSKILYDCISHSVSII